DPWGERLPRRLGGLSATAILVGSTIGSGIFRSPAEIASHASGVETFALAWIVGGLIALCGALSLSEVAALFPRTGGIYVYLREAFGSRVAFLFGWCELLILRPAAYGAIAIVSAEHLWRAIGRDGEAVFLAGPLAITRAQALAAAFIVVLGVVNFRGVRLGAIVQNVSTAFKVLAILVLVVAGLAFAPASSPDAATAVSATTSLSGFGLALVSVMWAYDGWADVGFVSGEVRAPQRNLPRAFIGGTAIIVALYMLLNIVYVKVIGIEAMPGRPLVAADVARALVGETGAKLVALLVAISTFGTLNGSLLTGPRVFFAMAEDGLFFRRLAAVHPRYGTPGGAILLSIGLGVAFVSVRTFGELADQFIIGIWPFYALAVAAVFVLRARRPALP
ncbi:MAG: APC family permease, partial [Nannocystaceae bacterium]